MSNPVQPGDRYRPTVLVVDDNPDQRELVRRMVERAGYACVVAADGREARGLLQAGTIEVAVTDVFMPDEDGLEFLRHVREQRPDLPILVVSGSGAHNPVAYLAMAMKLGATATLENDRDSVGEGKGVYGGGES